MSRTKREQPNSAVRQRSGVLERAGRRTASDPPVSLGQHAESCSAMSMHLCQLWDICARMDAHEGQAGWAQALGSILAVLLAIAVAQAEAARARKAIRDERSLELERRDAERIRARERLRAIRIVGLQLMEYARQRAGNLIDDMTIEETRRDPKMIFGLMATDIRSAEQRMATFPAHELESPRAVYLFVSSQTNVALAAWFLDRIAILPNPDLEGPREMSLWNSARNAATEIEKKIAEYRDLFDLQEVPELVVKLPRLRPS